MIWSVRVTLVTLIAAGFCFALGASARAGCIGLSGTADWFDKETAVSRAQLAVGHALKQTRRKRDSVLSP